MYSVKNAVYVAIMQIGVIVAGVLAAGMWLKVRREMDWAFATPAALLTDHTLIFMAIPLVWVACILFLNQRPAVSEGVNTLALFSGVLVLLGLVVFVVYADVGPFFSITWNLGGDDGR
jgi:uncharacterized membrane protein